MQKGEPDFKTTAEVVKAVYDLQIPEAASNNSVPRLPDFEPPQEQGSEVGVAEERLDVEPPPVEGVERGGEEVDQMEVDNLQHDADNAAQADLPDRLTIEGLYYLTNRFSTK